MLTFSNSTPVRSKRTQLLASLVSLLAISWFSAPSARASSTTYVLNVSGCCGSGPFGNITLTQTTLSEVTVQVALNNPYVFVDTGQAGAFAFNVANVPFANLAFALSAASINAGFSANVQGNGTFNQHMALFGSFEYAIKGDANHTQGGS